MSYRVRMSNTRIYDTVQNWSANIPTPHILGVRGDALDIGSLTASQATDAAPPL